MKWTFLLLLLAGCVTVKPVRLPDGTQGYSLNCRPGQHEWASCMNKAAELCHGPYQIVSQNSQTSGGAYIQNGQYGGTYVQGTQNELIVACHG